LNGLAAPDAFLLNSEDWAFGVFLIDEKSQRFYEENLSLVSNQQNFSEILSQFIIMMRQILYPATRIPKILHQCIDLKNENLIRAMQGALVAAKSVFLPQELQSDFAKDVCSFFLTKTKKEAKDNISLARFCAQIAIDFMLDEENLKKGFGWVVEQSGKIVIDGEDTGVEMTKEHLYSVLKKVFASGFFTEEERTKISEKVLGDDASDKGQRVKKICEEILPKAELKEKMWAEITDYSNNYSVQELQDKAESFMQRSFQLDLIKPFLEKYFDTIQVYVEKKERNFTDVFGHAFSPAFMGRQEDVPRFQALIDSAPVDKPFYLIILKKQFDVIDIIQRSRELCAKQS